MFWFLWETNKNFKSQGRRTISRIDGCGGPLGDMQHIFDGPSKRRQGLDSGEVGAVGMVVANKSGGHVLDYCSRSRPKRFRLKCAQNILTLTDF